MPARLKELLSTRSYTSVFAPWPYDKHGDHQGTFQALRLALAGWPEPLAVWLYEVWTPLEPNMHIAIDAVLETKLKALQRHSSQVQLLNYVEACRGLAAYRGLSCPPAHFAEAFFVCDGRHLTGQEGLANQPLPEFHVAARGAR